MDGQNKTVIIAAVVIILLLLGGTIFLLSRNNSAQQTTITNNTIDTTTNTNNTNTNTVSTPTGKVGITQTKTFRLDAQNGSGQNGTVVLDEVENKVQVTITLDNLSTTSEPAHIHYGSCPVPGAVIFPLSDVVNGSSVTMLDTSFANLQALGALAVNVHKSAADIGVYYSCGNLSF